MVYKVKKVSNHITHTLINVDLKRSEDKLFGVEVKNGIKKSQ